MGNPLSSIIADIVTQGLLEISLNSLKTQPKVLFKYVDDIFAVTNKNNISNILNALNTYHNKLQFTIENEKDGRLAFLDVVVLRGQNGKLITDWYKKECSSDRILNYHSNHPYHQKINTAASFINRVLSLSSTQYKTKNIHKIRDILHNNNFPRNIIRKLINNNQYRTTSNVRVTEQPKTKNKYKGLTYINGMSEKIAKVVNRCTTDIQVAHKSQKSLQSIYTKLKDKIPLNKKTDIIYEIPCLGSGEAGEICNKTYVGQTKQYLERRMSNHKNDLRKPYNSNLPNTAVVEHFNTLGHYPDFGKVKILDTVNHYNKRLILESLHIYKQNTYNMRRDTKNIAPVYCAIIERHKNKTRTN